MQQAIEKAKKMIEEINLKINVSLDFKIQRSYNAQTLILQELIERLEGIADHSPDVGKNVHSQQPSIDILTKWIDKTDVQAVNEADDNFLDGGAYYMEKVLKEIQSIPTLIPQEPTTDETILEMLLEEIPHRNNGATLHLYPYEDEWCAEYMYEMDSGMIDIGGYGTSPKLALLALKEKLKTTLSI